MKYLTSIIRRCTLQLFLLAVIVAQAPAQQPVPPGTPAAENPVKSAEALRQESFKIVWQTINDIYYDPTFGGVNWNNVRARYEPLVAKTRSDQELHELLQGMLNELHQSHFLVIPPEAIPKIRRSKLPKDNGAEDDDVVDNETDADEEELLDALNFKLTEKLSNGIGIDLRVMQGSAVVTRVEPGSPAARAGLRPGFVIKEVGGRSMDAVIAELVRNPLWGAVIRHELQTVLLAGFINGQEASSVRVGYFDGKNRLRTVNIKREKLRGEMSSALGNLPALYMELESKRLPGGIGYIRFNAFVPPLMGKLCGALRSMKNAPGVILDLRGNQGGLAAMVGGLSGLLETSPTSLGTMVTRSGFIPLYAFPQTAPYSGPLIILIDASTQSAGEIFASGLREAGRATLVGEQSAGNALPSAILKLPTGALFQYGIADYVTTSGRRLEGKGVTPDIPVKLSRKALLRGSDPQLTAAIRKVREEIQVNRWITRGELIADVTSTSPQISVAIGDPAKAPPPPPAPLPKSVVTISDPALAGLPSADSILEKYLEASGGRKAFDKLASRVSKGTIELTALAVNGTVEFYEQGPNRATSLINAPGIGIMQRTFDGSRGWVHDPLHGYINFTGLGLEIAKQASVFNNQTRLKELYPQAVVVGREKVESADAYVVRLGFEKWFFDVNTGLLLRKGDTHYADYREVDGVKLPFRIRENPFSGAGVVYQLTEIKHNVEIDATKFAEYPDCFTKP